MINGGGEKKSQFHVIAMGRMKNGRVSYRATGSLLMETNGGNCW
jgi:hypothetical protein